MNAEIIAIGDELTSGQRLDTNSQWLSQRLQELGVEVRFHSTVADDLEALMEVFRTATARCQIIVASGGLGPTADDLTREALAASAGVELQLDETALRHIEDLFQRRGREMPERNRLQAMFPQGSRPIANPHGTAPGIDFEVERANGATCRVFALPGVPAELFEMWTESVAPAIMQTGGAQRVVAHRRLKCFGAGESKIESLLPDLIRRGRQPSVGITAHAATITLRVTAAGANYEECEKLMAPTIQTIHECLDTKVFGHEDDELEHVVIRLLREQQKTLATAECGTSGRLGHWLSELDEAVGVYRGGMVAAPDTSAEILAAGETLARNGAQACREQFGADYGLAIGPIPAGADDATATFYFALASDDGVIVRTGSAAIHPAILKDLAAKQALNLLRLHLLRAP
jgi:nicotinamide-nucleotide amidase